MVITKKYANPNNGGFEQVTRDGDRYFINSDWGNGFRKENQMEVSRDSMATCLSFTGAPEDVRAEIMGK